MSLTAGGLVSYAEVRAEIHCSPAMGLLRTPSHRAPLLRSRPEYGALWVACFKKRRRAKGED